MSDLPAPVTGEPDHVAVPARRIMVVMHDFSGGGTERVAIRLANQWAKAGRTVHIFCGDPAGPARALVDDRVTVEQASPRLPRGPLSRIRLGFALAKAAQRFRPDAIFAPGNFHMLVLAAFAMRDKSGVATLCKISNPLVRRDRRGPAAWLRRLTLKALTFRIDSLIAMSPALEDEAAAVIGKACISMQWEPILPADFDPATPTDRDPDLIVAVGRLEPQKNFALAIQAMAHLCRWSSARLVILGEGQERTRLKGLIGELSLHGRVALPGHVGDIRPWLQRASCVLMTSRYEGYPASLIEAAACGAPIVVTPCSPALDDILPLAGAPRTIQPEPGALAAALREVLRRPAFVPPVPLLLTRHDEARVATSYLALIDKVVGEKRRPAGQPTDATR